MPEPPDVIAERFEIERLARSGGMGNVYRARDRQRGDGHLGEAAAELEGQLRGRRDSPGLAS